MGKKVCIYPHLSTTGKRYEMLLVERSEIGIRILDPENLSFIIVPEANDSKAQRHDVSFLDMRETGFQSAALTSSFVSKLPVEMVLTSAFSKAELIVYRFPVEETGETAAAEKASSCGSGPGEKDAKTTPQHCAGAMEGRIGRAIAFMESNYKEDIGLNQIAHTACLSSSHFCRLFKKQIGTTCTRVLSSMRIREAVKLLKETDLRITDICFETGFNDLTHFERVFKKILGTTPSMYRQHNL